MIHRYNFPTEIHFGPGARKLLPGKLKESGAAKPLLVTDSGVARLPFFAGIRELVPEAAVFADFAGNPKASDAGKGAEAFAAHKADSVVAVGGGAAIDVAKAVALRAGHPFGGLFDFAEGNPQPKPVSGSLPMIIALPTTAGTGSEVGRCTVISEDESRRKRLICSPKLMPGVVLADPELTVGLPAALTAATGMDAICHLIEAYLIEGDVNPLCDGIALEGLWLARKSLRRCVQSPEDLEARGDMLNASLMGAVAFQKGLGAVHACAHALSAVVDMHHGLANGIMLPFVMDFNKPAQPERFARMAHAVEVEDVPAWLRTLRADIGIPDTLAAQGVGPELLGELVETAFVDVCRPLNARPVSEADLREIFTRALGG